MGGTQRARGSGPVILGALGLALVAAWVALTYLTRDPQASRDGAALAFGLACGWLGVLVARHQPRNPVGWLLVGGAVGVIAQLDSGLYAVLDYRVHHGRLPLGEIAVFFKDTTGEPLIALLALVVLLFPDGPPGRTPISRSPSVIRRGSGQSVPSSTVPFAVPSLVRSSDRSGRSRPL